MTIKGIPEGYHTITPYLTIKGAADAMKFYKEAFGAIEKGRLLMPNGAIAHAEMMIGDSSFMLADEVPEWGNKSPGTLGGTATGISIYTDDVDRLFEQAVAAGATVQMNISNQFYGDRTGSVIDPYGHKWMLSTRMEDVSFEEMQKRFDAMGANQK